MEHTQEKTKQPSTIKNKQPFFSPAPIIQAKLKIGSPNDKYEREADAVADQVMRMPDQGVQMKCEACEENEIQIKPTIQRSPNGSMTASPEISSKISATLGGGKKLPSKTQSEMGSKMGADFNGVNIHTDYTAVKLSQDLGAKAFTVGNDIYFNKGQYNLVFSKGKRLLAHELTHVIQQNGAEGGQIPQLQRQKNEQGFGTYFKDCMESMGLPAPSSIFGTLSLAIANITAIHAAVITFGVAVTIGELIGAGVLSEKLLALTAFTASFYVGAAVGCLATATGQSFSGGYGLNDVLDDFIGPRPGLWIADVFGI